MKWVALCLALGTLASSQCKSEAPPVVYAGSCPQFPPKPSDQKGGAYASTSFGGMKPHAPPKQHLAVPSGSLDSVRITLERTGCFGTCPSYRVEVRGDGAVSFHGDGYVIVPGDHETRVSPDAIQCLLTDFRAADFWSLDKEYVAGMTDLPTYKISLSIGGKTKELIDYAGQAVGMPPVITALEQAIDEAAGTDTWIAGNSKTVAALEAEHFDFHGRTAAQLLAVAVAQDAPDEVVYGLLDHGVPIDGASNGQFDEGGITAIEAAAMYGRIALVNRLIKAGAFEKGGKPLINATLRASVASQRADMVAEILKYHPDVNSRNKSGDTALALILTGAHPHYGDDGAPDEDVAIIKMLGKAGADPNLRNSEQEDLLELAYSQEDKDALVSIGAKRTKPAH